MRGVGDFGRGGAGLGRDGDHFLGQPGSEGGASRRDRDGAAGRASGGRQGAARTGDERSDDFQRRLGNMIERTERGGARAGRDDDSRGDGGEGSVQTGAAPLFALFRPNAPAAPPDSGRAKPIEGMGGAAGSRPVAATEKADPAAAADRDGSTTAVSAPRSLRVLAVSEPSTEQPPGPWVTQAQGHVLLAPIATQARAPDASRVERAAARIEEALRADAAPEGPVTIAVPVDPGLDGLVGLTVTLTPAGLDVVLDRVPGAVVSDGLAAAAQDLVARLQRRLPRGSVRVLERGERADVAEGGPMPGLVRPQT